MAIKGHLDSNVYQEVPLNPDKKVFQKLKSLVEKYRSNLTKREVDYLISFKWQNPNIYFTPKVHKCKTIQRSDSTFNWRLYWSFQPEDLKIWPTISGTEIPTQRLSYPIEIAPCLTAYAKDDLDFLQFLPSSLNFDSVLYSYNIESLYTSIPIDLDVKAIDYWITRKHKLIPEQFTKEFIIDSMKFILKNNNFLFDSKCTIRFLKQPWELNMHHCKIALL